MYRKSKLLESTECPKFVKWTELDDPTGEIKSLATFMTRELENYLNEFNDGSFITESFIDTEEDESGCLELIDTYGDHPIVDIFFGFDGYELARGKRFGVFRVTLLGLEGDYIYNLYDISTRDLAEEIVQSMKESEYDDQPVWTRGDYVVESQNRLKTNKKRFKEAGGFKQLSTKKGSISDLILKHNEEIKALEGQLDANEKLKDIVANFAMETDSEAVIAKIQTDILPTMERQNYARNVNYLWQIILKGDGLSNGKLYDRSRRY